LTTVAAAAIVVSAGFALRARRGDLPRPPHLADLGPLAPEIADIVRQAVAAVDENPGDASRWGRFGMVCEANGLAVPARDGYIAASHLDPGEPRWWFHLANVEARLGNVDAAVSDMRRAIDRNASYAPAHWRLGLWLLDENHTEGAERAFSRATEIDPADRAGWIGLARVYLQRAENERAAGLLERLVSSGAEDRYALQLLGTAYRRLGRVDEASSALVAGAKGEAQWSDPWNDEMAGFRRGYAARLKDATAYVVAGQFAPAIRILEDLRREKPDDIVLMAHLGQVYVAAGDAAAGVPLLEQVVAREPERFEAYVDLATGYMHQDKLANARAAIERALAIEPSFGPAHETHGLVLWRDGDPHGAVAAFDAAVRADPRNARPLIWMGMVETNQGRAAAALAAFERAARIDPTSVDAWVGIANAQMNRRDFGAAAKALANAERLQPDRPAVKETARRLHAAAPQ